MSAIPLYTLQQPGAIVPPGAGSPALLDERGQPQPPAHILAECKKRDPHIGLRFANGLSGRGWAITWEWPAGDPRWARVRSGDVDPDGAYDIVGYLPFGCSVEDAPGYIDRSLRQYPVEEIRRIADRTTEYNKTEVPKQQVAEMVGDVVADARADLNAPKGLVTSVPSGTVQSKIMSKKPGKK